VAEWRHNKTDVPTQIKILADVIKEIHSVVKDEKKIYYSVENNTIGEAALISINEYGEENIKGYFLSDNSVTGTTGRRFRKGFNTTFGSKISTCAKIKYLVEEDKCTLYSRPLISQLKSYIAAGTSFKAKEGQHDDLVAAFLLIIRMGLLLAEWDPAVFDQIKVHSDWAVDENYVPPLPIYISMG
jgi:hypothetical protein